jgi:hypothetical protein
MLVNNARRTTAGAFHRLYWLDLQTGRSYLLCCITRSHSVWRLTPCPFVASFEYLLCKAMDLWSINTLFSDQYTDDAKSPLLPSRCNSELRLLASKAKQCALGGPISKDVTTPACPILPSAWRIDGGSTPCEKYRVLTRLAKASVTDCVYPCIAGDRARHRGVRAIPARERAAGRAGAAGTGPQLPGHRPPAAGHRRCRTTRHQPQG